MTHKNAFEAVDVMLRDIRSQDILMGGLIVILAGDFRQTLTIVQIHLLIKLTDVLEILIFGNTLKLINLLLI